MFPTGRWRRARPPLASPVMPVVNSLSPATETDAGLCQPFEHPQRLEALFGPLLEQARLGRRRRGSRPGTGASRRQVRPRRRSRRIATVERLAPIRLSVKPPHSGLGNHGRILDSGNQRTPSEAFRPAGELADQQTNAPHAPRVGVFRQDREAHGGLPSIRFLSHPRQPDVLFPCRR